MKSISAYLKKTGLLRDQRFLMFLVFILLNIVFGVITNNFFSKYNYFNMFRQAAQIIIVGCGGVLLMMTGNYDLSTGSNVAFSGVLYALLGSVYGWPLYLAAIVCIFGGLIFGVINGTLVAKFNFPPFIASLGMMYIGRGLALVACNGQSIRENMPANWSKLARGSFAGLPIPMIIMIGFMLLFMVITKKSLLGKYAMAIGGNKQAAYFSGINDKKVIFSIYIIVGALAALSGVMFASRIGAGDPRVAYGFEFDVIVAILLGGTSISGGKGTIIGMFLGAMVVTVLGNGLNMMNILAFWQQILKGIILVLAIVMNEQLSKSEISYDAEAVSST
jgi:ribose/xylose/arabinose/galactoside ABC-type transport system permease subunit